MSVGDGDGECETMRVVTGDWVGGEWEVGFRDRVVGGGGDLAAVDCGGPGGDVGLSFQFGISSKIQPNPCGVPCHQSSHMGPILQIRFFIFRV